MRKHGLTDDLLEHVFDFNDQVELIAMPPGKNNREKTVNAGAACFTGRKAFSAERSFPFLGGGGRDALQASGLL